MAGSDGGPAASPASRYELGELIGKGSFGTVHRGYDTVAQMEVAIKLIDLEDIEEDIAEIQREISMLKQCQSPNITAYYGSAVVPGTSQLMIVMELLAASAADLVSEETGGEPLGEACIAFVVREVLRALAYLHSQHRIHRDVKAANILLSPEGAVKVSDFGVSAQLGGTVGFKRRTFVGSPLWMAPEVIEQSPDTEGFRGDAGGAPPDGYDEAADIWSLGITAIELAEGEPPRAHLASFRLLFMIVRDDPPQLEGGQWSTELKDFVWQCLRKDPSARPSAEDLLEHPFVAGAQQPPELRERVAAWLQRRPALLERQQARVSGGGGFGTVGATMPRWDFAAGGGGGGGNGTLAAARPVTAPGAGGMQRTAAGAADLGGTLVRRHTDAELAAADYGGTVQVRPAGDAEFGMPVAAAAPGGLAAAAPPSRLFIPNDPTQPDQPLAAAAGGYLAGPASAVGGGGGGGGGDGGATRQLLQAGLQAAAGGPGAGPGAAAAAETASAALGQLEAARPGAVRDALTEVLTQLSLASSPSLAALQGSASALFGDGGGAAGVGGQPGDVPELGPLGRFLMSRWREAVARERVLHTQQWQAS
ncbi:hypothetical protein CHLNCDRAFT_136164 [Chlorella variabilis]|uniref:non-specific serine/threonine protein kinase n=1 Tax=Chlorella variabilis TaxID=554065 RepID=E1ZJW9_CHLVA|nr:hypothetical protein CHLNCDRAFT_136164 [Chlorella variabilis]EFN54067.1 hypothetical protein CHLNCDRAFT_136164 [Chlorella variabilis]|eukprot:XP_005846169.1 hypothetical protein CHLNCDRAFT_136164 [Chlorella variabilis]